MEERVTGRFAPTPSGRLHLGNLLCCLLAYLSVRSHGGRFLLRIEDLDVPRCPQRLSMQAIEDLSWFGFRWDEKPLFQSERSSIYQQHLETLEKQGLIYPCFCTRAQLMASAAPNLGDTQVVYQRTCANLSPEEIGGIPAYMRQSFPGRDCEAFPNPPSCHAPARAGRGYRFRGWLVWSSVRKPCRRLRRFHPPPFGRAVRLPAGRGGG